MLELVFLVLLAGAVGGLVNSLLANEFHLPKKDAEAGVFRPGWIGNVAIGAIAAIALWGLYGPHANDLILGANPGSAIPPTLKLAELTGALVSGIGGSRLLAAEVDKATLRRENTALNQTKNNLAAAVSQLTSGGTR